MIIRKATFEDSETIAKYLLLAMDEIIYKFIGERNPKTAYYFVLHFVGAEKNQYSYENCFVAEENDQILGAVAVYEGGRLHELRQPVIDYVRLNFNPDFNPEDETERGEFYIDALGVSPNHQGKGIGSKLLQFLIEEYITKYNETLGLLVEEENPNAKKLYLKLGFKVVGTKTLVGKTLEHLQLKRE
ncbi:GNAT family N-acetyltransferase [Flavobacterium psychroterrae]|uniref:GNAT family N-acetyltransferase n=1 Tax=Flavobacterium psychroterrae TaxID=2133767 RepID=A0ABS5PCZ6_9FLAO|nr:GNAT family N-acetyltransferase [Flavobacterium psychroterrae]MBS7232170.1 GNAT family N-acetyltransferase [Flavobacterium psychroterrae]